MVSFSGLAFSRKPVGLRSKLSVRIHTSPCIYQNAVGIEAKSHSTGGMISAAATESPLT